MKNYSVKLMILVFGPFTGLSSQTNSNNQGSINTIQSITFKNDTVINISLENNFQVIKPNNVIEYTITNYKNIDIHKTNPLQLKAAGLQTEVYISNTQQGIIIISSAEPNNTLADYNSILLANPNYYGTYSTSDTIVVLTGTYNNPVFDFTKASLLKQEYKNAYNYPVDPHTGVSWSKISNTDNYLINPYTGKYWNKNSDEFYNQEWGQSQGFCDLIIVFPKLKIR